MSTELIETTTDSAPVLPADTDSWVQMVGQVAKLAAHIADTEFVPKGLRGSSAAVTAAILYGREIGLPPMTALTMVHVVEGRPALAAEAMRSLILAAGHDLEIRAATGAIATVAGRRRGTGRWQEVTWNMDMARAAGVVKDKSAWVTYPRAMLVARATVELARQLFPDVIHGFRATEEITDEITTETERLALAPPPGPTVRRAPRAPRKAAAPKIDLPHHGDAAGATAPPPLPGEPGYTETPTTGEGQTPPAAPVVGPPETSAGGGAPVGETTSAEPSAEPEIEVLEAEPEPKARGVDVQAVRLTFEKKLGVTDRDTRLAYITGIIGREIATSKALTRREAGTVLDTLGYCTTTEDLDNAIAAAEAHRAATDGPDTP